ncbi:hypothetical protein RJ639_017682 [Escallonia herrerae]|uniref:Uncharacterized protein n=1 Tax=Escallonia herrerae TaxID=1293975 RepID=A0AA88VDB7_9ASTE|nr:hypothetical protein RJ639_017682 [Escallonia herrerae]
MIKGPTINTWHGKLNDFYVTSNQSKEPIFLSIKSKHSAKATSTCHHYGEVEDLVHFPQYSATCFQSFRSIGIGSFGSRRCSWATRKKGCKKVAQAMAEKATDEPWKLSWPSEAPSQSNDSASISSSKVARLASQVLYSVLYQQICCIDIVFG